MFSIVDFWKCCMYNFLKLFVAFRQLINKTLVNSHYIRKTVVTNQRLINFDDFLNDAGKPMNFLHYFVNDFLGVKMLVLVLGYALDKSTFFQNFTYSLAYFCKIVTSYICHFSSLKNTKNSGSNLGFLNFSSFDFLHFFLISCFVNKAEDFLSITKPSYTYFATR